MSDHSDATAEEDLVRIEQWRQDNELTCRCGTTTVGFSGRFPEESFATDCGTPGEVHGSNYCEVNELISERE